MSAEEKAGDFRLEIPLDASGIEGFKPDQPVKVVLQERDGSTHEKRVKLDAKGKGSAAFTFAKHPGALRVAVGPGDASADELLGMQTINLNLSTRLWGRRRELVLDPILIHPYYWHWWLIWCRNFTIRGRVLCPDGNPVPGATVCAYDVDMWWWWSSRQSVGCTTTDSTGSFEIKFRWCCGWWPWWWWLRRVWVIEPYLVERIMPMLQREFEIKIPPIPDPTPDPVIFEDLLTQIKEPDILDREPLEHLERHATGEAGCNPRAGLNPTIDFAKLDRIRVELSERLPRIAELEPLRLWPWWPWHPWWDCRPDIIFQVTQNCRGSEEVIVDETCLDARWNIPTLLNVTLTAGENACCVEPEEDPEGVCMLISHACDALVKYIGENPDADPTLPAGYRTGDRPYAGVVPIYGLFGDLVDVDYYEFEWSDDGGTTWKTMPPAAAGGFSRTYWGPMVGTSDPPHFHGVPFHFTDISGHRVVMSRQHFEANNDPGSWGITRLWTGNRNLLMRWITQKWDQTLNFADGTYRLRVKSWNIGAGGNLINERILPLCNTTDENWLTLRLDNRLVGAGSGHPTSPDHPCGAGTIHLCATEPDTDFLDVRVNGVKVKVCDIVDASAGGTLEIDFMAHDPDGHLSHYTLYATYGENLAINLLGLASGILTSGPGGAPVPPAAQVGSSYSQALSQGATRPIWHGGTIRLTIPDLRVAFPITCAYQLELRAYKRTIANCADYLPFRNRSEFSITVKV